MLTNCALMDLNIRVTGYTDNRNKTIIKEQRTEQGSDLWEETIRKLEE